MISLRSNKGKFALVVVVVVVYFAYCVLQSKKRIKDADLASLVMQWEGFGPERGVYNFTVVTAMLDIGRGQWSSSQKRSYNKYLLLMQRMLRLDVNMVVFVDAKGKPFVDWMRRGREKRTKVIVTNLKELPYYTLRDRIQEIMSSNVYREDNELVRKNLCESTIPEYDILQHSKFYFMDQAIAKDIFQTDYFVWLDAGYGHGDDVYPVNGIWIPSNMVDHPGQMTFIERDPGVTAFRKVKDRIHKMSINIIAGLFFGGGKEAHREAYRLQQEQLAEWLEQGIIDDDQTMYMMLYYKKPSLFNLVRGDWDDVFTKFGKMPLNS